MASSTTRRDVYQDVTDTILEALEQGTIPWRKPWATAGLQRNADSGRAYTSINQLLLQLSEFGDPRWVTFKGAKRMGGSVRKGERGRRVVFFKSLEVDDRDKPGRKKTIPMLKQYSVFNVTQCDGLDLEPLEVRAAEHEPIDAAQALLEGYADCPAIAHGGDAAYYAPTEDRIQLPEPSRFEDAESYYATAFHESVHSTGHTSRLDRGLGQRVAPFGSADYSREELVAEFGAAFLSAEAGISPATLPRSAGYIEHWMQMLKADKKAAVWAAGRAQKAADYVQGREVAAG